MLLNEPHTGQPSLLSFFEYFFSFILIEACSYIVVGSSSTSTVDGDGVAMSIKTSERKKISSK